MRTTLAHHLVTSVVLVLASAACADSSKPAAEATPEEKATKGEAPKKTGAAPAPAGGSERSKPPTVSEWNEVTREVTVNGSSALSCETKMLREWLRVSCRGTDPKRGLPTGVTVSKKSGSRTDEVFTFAAGGVASLVFPFVPGTSLEASFAWTNEQHSFVSSWPHGAPMPASKGRFQ